MRKKKTDQTGPIIREATAEEVARMVGWVRWAYDQRLTVVWYPKDNTITLVPSGRSLDGHEVQFLQKGGGHGESVQGSAGQAAAEEGKG